MILHGGRHYVTLRYVTRRIPPPRRSLSTLVHLPERTTINCKHLAARLSPRFRLAARAVSRQRRRLCIDSSHSLSSMFPSLLVRHRRANPLSRGIISPVYATLELMCIKAPSPSISFESKRVRRHVSRHAMPSSRRIVSRRVASTRSVLYKVLHRKKSHCATGGLRCGFVRVEWELEVISLRHNAR